MRTISHLVLAIIAVALACIGGSAIADDVSDRDRALLVMSSNDSHIATQDFRRITSAEMWSKTWLEHLGLDGDTIYRCFMEINYDRCMVVAVFGGNKTNLCGYEVDSVQEQEERILVRFIDIDYQTAGPDGGADQVTPYAFIVLPKSDKPIVLEETVRSMVPGQALLWTEVAQLEAGKE